MGGPLTSRSGCTTSVLHGSYPNLDLPQSYAAKRKKDGKLCRYRKYPYLSRGGSLEIPRGRGGLGDQNFNLFIPKIRKLILLTDDHTFLCWQVLRIWCYPNSITLIVRKIYILITPGSQRVKRKYEIKLEFPEGWGVETQKLSVGGVWNFLKQHILSLVYK